MSYNKHTIRLHSIISRTLYQVQSGEKLRNLSSLIGISDEGYVDFLMGLIYSSTQDLFRKESGLSVEKADGIFLEFWKKEGRNIRTRLLQKIEGD